MQRACNSYKIHHSRLNRVTFLFPLCRKIVKKIKITFICKGRCSRENASSKGKAHGCVDPIFPCLANPQACDCCVALLRSRDEHESDSEGKFQDPNALFPTTLLRGEASCMLCVRFGCLVEAALFGFGQPFGHEAVWSYHFFLSPSFFFSIILELRVRLHTPYVGAGIMPTQSKS